MDTYKKKYKEALERAKYYQKENGSAVISAIFPELKESEDERIRKDLIAVFKGQIPFTSEKDAKRYIAWLEKQGEQKPILDFKAKDWYVSKVDGKIHNIYHSVDKVEPKFKVGDWIVHNERKHIIKVVNLTPLVCEVVNILGYHHTITDTAIENNYHLWTIQDAKDGDVLACENGWTCIFNCFHDNLFSSHCFMDAEGWFCEDGGQAHTLDHRICGEIHPATKEQRDILFQKMKEAGYIFDFEKKELKKLKFRVGDEVITENEESLTITRIDEKGYWSNDLFICGFDDAAKWELVEQKLAWSEKDERILDALITSLNNEVFTGRLKTLKGIGVLLVINWLKSLKQRIGG